MERERISIVIVGDVDHGKSSVLGRLLVDSGAIALDRLRAVEAECRQRGVAFEYSYVTDALHDERKKGITIDMARVVMRLGDREILFFDCPGHEELLRNLATGAARAQYALVVCDVTIGITPVVKRQFELLSLLDLTQIVIVANKMDQVDPRGGRFAALQRELIALAETAGKSVVRVIPVSASTGLNIVGKESKSFYQDLSLSETLLVLPAKPNAIQANFRFPVQSVTTLENGSIVALGSITSGRITRGEGVHIQPQGKPSRVTSLLQWPNYLESAEVGSSIGIALGAGVELARGDILTGECGTKSQVANCATIRCLPLRPVETWERKKLLARINTNQVECEVAIAASRGEQSDMGLREVTVQFENPVAFDLASFGGATSHIALLSDNTLVAFGRFIAAT